MFLREPTTYFHFGTVTQFVANLTLITFWVNKSRGERPCTQKPGYTHCLSNRQRKEAAGDVSARAKARGFHNMPTPGLCLLDDWQP